ncbi:MAG: hypothetical protein EP338_03685 [Bacteroidetes bacterium]|nr:MAG: hypothetical protein EP338_03685 [Bacteroidota bacterium]
MKFFHHTISFCAFMAPALLWSQNFDHLNKKDLVKVSGGLNFNNTIFASDRVGSVREPYAWYASGNINITALGMSFPFSYSISNQGKNFSQPSNLTSINPSYKWFKSHIGRTSMSFSPYTLSGVTYSGAGVELTPKKFSLKAMFGQLNKAVEYNVLENNINSVAYRRWAGALSLGYKINQTDFKLMFLKAFDDPNSLDFVPGLATVKPKDNIVASFQVKTQIKKFSIETEAASSILTDNLRNEENIHRGKWYSFLYPMARGNGTTSLYNAFKGGINYNLKFGRFGFNYERIDPGYQTLGGLFFNNDLENFTFSPSFSLFKQKLNLSLNTGLQKNNLSKDKAAETNRWVGSVNVSAKIAKGLNGTITYSNFSAYTRNNPQIDPFTNQVTYLDTFNVYQISQNMVTTLNYSFGKKNPSSISSSFTYQNSQNITGDLENARAFGINASGAGNPAKTYVGTLSYTYSIKSQKVSLSMNGNANYSDFDVSQTLFIGPSTTIRKSFGKNKPSLSGGVTYNRNFQNGELTNNIFNYRLSGNYSPKMKNEKIGVMSFSLNALYLNKLPTVKEGTTINELTIVANVSYNFK